MSLTPIRTCGGYVLYCQHMLVFPFPVGLFWLKPLS